MQALVSVNGVDLPEPSSYSATTSTIVDSGRNVQGCRFCGSTRCCKSGYQVELPYRKTMGFRYRPIH